MCDLPHCEGLRVEVEDSLICVLSVEDDPEELT